MYELGNYIMRTAISAACEFAKIKPGFFINVNASSEQLEKESFVKDTLTILKEYDFPPTQLWIEITERCRDLPVSMIKKTVTALREAGIHITMDDYGTGSSSSQMILELPVEGIKIDMCFVSDIFEEKKKQALVIGMVNFAHAADLRICIEGIENSDLESYLRQFDVTLFQGYHYSKPICQDELMKLLIKP
jgi:EAL domain-containing protein (putative c-di-GMP-specific phosphodiesterase class I)